MGKGTRAVGVNVQVHVGGAVVAETKFARTCQMRTLVRIMLYIMLRVTAVTPPFFKAAEAEVRHCSKMVSGTAVKYHYEIAPFPTTVAPPWPGKRGGGVKFSALPARSPWQ